MIQLIVGKKGSGKTKKLIQQTNEAVATRHGSVVFVDDDKDYLYDVNHKARFIDAREYNITNADMFYGFICGLAAQDFDLDIVYVDAFLRIVGTDMTSLEGVFKKLEEITKQHTFDMVISVSANASEIPDFAKAWIQE